MKLIATMYCDDSTKSVTIRQDEETRRYLIHRNWLDVRSSVPVYDKSKAITWAAEYVEQQNTEDQTDIRYYRIYKWDHGACHTSGFHRESDHPLLVRESPSLRTQWVSPVLEIDVKKQQF